MTVKTLAAARRKPLTRPAVRRVMVVDDDPDVRKVLALLLKSSGLNAIEASSGAHCLKLLASTRPAVILLDLMMPEMDGFEVCQALKRDPTTAEIPIIVVTARDDSLSRMRAARLGVSDFLVKPVSKERLLNRVRAQIELLETMNRTQAAIDRLTAAPQVSPLVKERGRPRARVQRARGSLQGG